MKVIRCRTCKKIILKSEAVHVSKEKILSAIRKHYKKNHPKRFKGFTKKAIKTKREKGIINKKNPKENTIKFIVETKIHNEEKLKDYLKKAPIGLWFNKVD